MNGVVISGMIVIMKIEENKTEDALFVIREAAQWLIDIEQPLWKLEDLTEEFLFKDQGTIPVVAYQNHEPAAAMILQWHDPLFWPEIRNNESAFVHKLSVRRKYKGQGFSTALLNYAATLCNQKGIGYLRLDCDASRMKLRDFYRSEGFSYVEQREVDSFKVALFVKTLSPADS